MSLRPKMILSLIPVLILLILGMIAFSYNSLQTSAQSEIRSEAEAISSKQVVHFTDSLNETYGAISAVARQLSTNAATGNADRNEIFISLKREIEGNPDYLGVWTLWEPDAFDDLDQTIAAARPADASAIAPDDLIQIFATESGAINLYWVREDDKIVPLSGDDAQREEPYYTEALNNKTPAFPAYTDDTINQLMVSVAVPIIVDGKALGVVGADISMDRIQSGLAELHPYETGYVMLFNGEGLVVAAPDKKLIGQPMGEEFTEAERAAVLNHSNIVEESESPFTHEDVLTYYNSIKTTDGHSVWTFAVALPKDKIFAESRASIQMLMIIGVAGIVLATIIISLVISSMVKALREGVNYAETVANGDLDQSYTSNRKDELGVLAGALGRMVANLKGRILEAEKMSREAEAQSRAAEEATRSAQAALAKAEAGQQTLLEAAGQVDGVVTQLSAATQNLSTQVIEASTSADSQRNRVAESSSAMENMNGTIRAVSSSAINAAEASERVKSKALTGEEIVRNSVQAIEAVQSDSRILRTNIEALGDQAKSIGSIITVINDIADQTNLLALNAAIEAARAGEAGRGFAVVADEVRKLAEKTVVATKDVGEAIIGIQKGTEQSVSAVEKTTANLASATELVNKSGEALAEIVSEAVHTAEQVHSIAQGVEMQAEAGEIISRVLENINVAAEETAEVMNAAGETVEGVAAETRQLQALVASLREG